VISLAPGTKVYLASKPVSMRLGFDGLAALVRPLFAVEPYGGHVFLFRSKSGNYLKALLWDGTGLCLFAKRLEHSRFVWPPLIGGGVVLTPAQFALLIEAMDWRRTVALDPPRLPLSTALKSPRKWALTQSRCRRRKQTLNLADS
jgi:transposase